MGTVVANPALAQTTPADGICRVAPSATGAASGADWANPMALDSALANNGCAEIWAQHGTYKPTMEMDFTPSDPDIEVARTKAFAINRPLKLYGGFAGTEASVAARVLNPAQPTVLSGDLHGDDVAGTAVSALGSDATRADNSYHVVVIGGLDMNPGNGIYTAANTVLDGLTITAGQGNGSSWTYHVGGGLLCNGSGVGNVCNPTISNANFSGNYAHAGGAIYNMENSSPVISNVNFSGNYANYDGGAIFNNNSNSTISNATFSDNSAGRGGAIYNNSYSSPTISYATFSGNYANYGGSIYNDWGNNPVISNATFFGNSANYDGGAIYNSFNSRPTVSNTTFSENSAINNGGAIYNELFSVPTITASILWGNGATPIFNSADSNSTVNHSIVQGSGGSTSWNSNFGTDDGHNLDVDPQLSILGDHGGPTHTMLPDTGSPAIDAYDCSSIAIPPLTDQRGVLRNQGARCDMGAVEVVTANTITQIPSSPSTGMEGSLASASACTLSHYQFSAPAGTVPAGMRFEGQQLAWLATGCSNGGSAAQATITLTLPSAAPANAKLYKFYNNSWNDWSSRATFSNGRRTITYTVIDNDVGDSDLALGTIRDPVVLAVPLAAAATGTVAVPTLSQWALAWMGLLLFALAAWQLSGRAYLHRGACTGS